MIGIVIMQHTTYILIGSNIGNSADYLKQAVEYINRQVGKVVLTSSVYKTAAWGNTEQPPFLNQLLQVETELLPHTLMQTLLQIETEMGRVRQQKWESRIIDLDILFYDDMVIQGNLNIPHPLLQERRFALEPLVEIAPDLWHPVLHKTATELLKACPDQSFVEKL